MKLKKIKIENFKSIEKLELDIKKYGSSYATFFLGINESGKSNILEAISLFDTPESKFDYNLIHNQKDNKNGPIDLWFYLDFDQNEDYIKFIQNECSDGGEVLDFKVKNILKNVYLQKGDDVFSENYEYEIEGIKRGICIKKVQNTITEAGRMKINDILDIKRKAEADESYKDLNEETVKEFLGDIIVDAIKQYEPEVSRWVPSEKYLLSSVDLNSFKDKPDSNIPLKNIFALSNVMTAEEIKEKIEEISNDQLRRKLSNELSKNTTNYVQEIWKHKIKFDIDISDSKKCTVSIKDEGDENEFNFHKMTSRSEGFKQFMSLILSLSVETKAIGKKNGLILIDEPEAHLHPSGIRDLKEELLDIGENNYLFVSTHSPFLVDRNNKERNIVIYKNEYALTEKTLIKDEEDIRDDEVLDLAFGINVYKDLLNPNRILVEGSTDKKIFQKALMMKDLDFGITNGSGGNIVQVASRLNYDEIKVFVVVDDDPEGENYKDKIRQIGGIFGDNNVYTIRDIVGEVTSGSTVEDLLGSNFIGTQFKKFYKEKFNSEIDPVFSLEDNKTFIQQIKVYLQKENKFTKDIIEDFKTQVCNKFNPSKSSFSTNFPLLDSLITKIDSKLKNE